MISKFINKNFYITLVIKLNKTSFINFCFDFIILEDKRNACEHEKKVK